MMNDLSDPLAPARQSAAQQLGVPVIDAALFSRQSNEVAKRLAGSATFGGPLARMALKRFQKAQAGGLPEHFLLAVTADEVVALERTLRTTTRDGIGEAGPEVARWKRSELRVECEEKGYRLYVTLDHAGETVRCAVGNIDATQDFVGLLADAAR